MWLSSSPVLHRRSHLETWFPLVLPPLLHFCKCGSPVGVRVGHVGQVVHRVQVGPQAGDGGLGRGHEGGGWERSMGGQGGVHVTATEGIDPEDGAGTLLHLVAAVPTRVAAFRAQELLLDADQVHGNKGMR